MLSKLNITSEEYFALDMASNSGIKLAYDIFTGGVERDLRNAYRFGSAIDALLTAPDETDLTDMTDQEISQLLSMRKAFRKDPIYQGLFANKHTESQVVFVEDDFRFDTFEMEVSLKAKCKFDFWNNHSNFGGDLKSTQAKTQEEFENAAKMFGYPRQAAWYMDISGSDRFVIIAVSKVNSKCFYISIKRGDPSYILGQQQYLIYATSYWKLNPTE
jgi:hypothetical protein